MTIFEGFDMGDVVEVRVVGYTVGPGQSAQLVAVELEVYRSSVDEPETVAMDFEGEGPTLAQVEAVARAINRLRGGRGGEATSP